MHIKKTAKFNKINPDIREGNQKLAKLEKERSLLSEINKAMYMSIAIDIIDLCDLNFINDSVITIHMRNG